MVAGIFVSDHCARRTLETEKNTRSCPFAAFDFVRFHDDLETFSLVRGSP